MNELFRSEYLRCVTAKCCGWEIRSFVSVGPFCDRSLRFFFSFKAWISSMESGLHLEFQRTEGEDICLFVLIDDVVSYLNFMPSQLWRSYYGRTPFIKSQFRFQFTVYSTSGKENEVKWTWNAELAQAKLLAAGETHKATFWPTPGLTESTFITVLDSEQGGLTFCVWNSAPWKYSEEWDWRNLLGHTEKSVMAQNSQHIWKKMYFENIFVCCFTGYSGDP